MMMVDPFHFSEVLRNRSFHSLINLYIGERKLQTHKRFYDFPKEEQNRERLITLVKKEKNFQFDIISSAIVFETLAK